VFHSVACAGREEYRDRAARRDIPGRWRGVPGRMRPSEPNPPLSTLSEGV